MFVDHIFFVATPKHERNGDHYLNLKNIYLFFFKLYRSSNPFQPLNPVCAPEVFPSKSCNLKISTFWAQLISFSNKHPRTWYLIYLKTAEKTKNTTIFIQQIGVVLCRNCGVPSFDHCTEPKRMVRCCPHQLTSPLKIGHPKRKCHPTTMDF